MKDFKGVYTALLTPFDENENVNFSALEKLVEFNIASGVTGLYVCGSTGEGMLMNEQERIEVLRSVKKCVGDRCILIAHVGTISTSSAIRMAKAAEEFGYDAVSAVAPFYYGFNITAIEQYYKDIIDSTELPMILYNFSGTPGGIGGMMELVENLLENPKFIGVKHTTTNLYDLDKVKHFPKPLFVYNGCDEMLIAGLSMGADGGIGSTYNLLGKQIVTIYNSFNNGDMETAMKTQNIVNRILDQLLSLGLYGMLKETLTQMGIPMGGCRRPFVPISDEAKVVAKQIAEYLLGN